MLKWICAVALAAGAASPAFAQKPKPKDSPPKIITQYDVEPIKEGIRTIKQSGECVVTFIVGVNGKTKEHSADCTVPGFAPYAIRAVQATTWEPEILDGDKIESYPRKQAFKFGAVSAPDPRGEKGPVLVKPLDGNAIERVINRVDDAGTCNVLYTVGADGKPKDIQPNCSMPAFNSGIAEVVGQMEYEPGLKGGQPTDWPGMQMPMNLTKPAG
jgi:hypothetical protein